MNLLKRAWALSAGLITVTALTVGCQDRVTQEDVNDEREDAREAVQEAREDLAETNAEHSREIAMAEREREESVADLNRQLSDPDANATEIRNDIAETNREADAKIAEIRNEAAKEQTDIKQDVQEEVNEAERTRMNYEAQQARDAYVKQTEQRVAAIDKDIETLRTRGDALTGPAEERFDTSIDLVDERRDEVDDAIDAMKSAEPRDWKSYQDEVENALKQLKSAHDAAAAEIRS